MTGSFSWPPYTAPALSDHLTAEGDDGKIAAIGAVELPQALRAQANASVIDTIQWFGDTSGGTPTYALEKAAHVEARPWLRQTIVVPARRDRVMDAEGVRLYRLPGPRIPLQRPYRFMLPTRSVLRIVRHESPDMIEVGNPFSILWITKFAARTVHVPMVCFAHTNVPRQFAANSERDGAGRRAVARASAWDLCRLDPLCPLTIVASDYSADDLGVGLFGD